MIVNRTALTQLAPIKDMLNTKHHYNGVSHGLSEAGYDIRIRQTVHFWTDKQGQPWHAVDNEVAKGHFVLASAMEEFQMPDRLVGIVHDKSTWARHGLSVFNTVIEPGFHGGLTLELSYKSAEPFLIHAGSGIAQVLFHWLTEAAQYNGKYQHQATEPVAPIFA